MLNCLDFNYPDLPTQVCVCVCVRAFYTIRFALSNYVSHIVDLSLINKGTGR